MHVAVCEHPSAGNFSSIIDTCRSSQCHVGAADQIVQVNHRSTVLPQKRATIPVVAVVVGTTRHLILGINLVSVTAKLAGKYPEVRHRPVLPEKREERLIPCVRRPANNRARLVDCICSSEISSESAQV